MDPFTALIFAAVIAGVFTKNIVQDSVFKATGKLPPSHLRQQERMRLAADAVKSIRAGRKPRAPEKGFRGFFANAYNDAWETADEIRRHRRDKRAAVRHQKWAAEDGQPDAMPAPVTTDAKPEAEPTDTIPKVSDQTPEPVKPTSESQAAPESVVHKNSPYILRPAGKEESLYQRYAMRRRNGGQPMAALAIADEFGVPLAEGEKLKTEWDARYARETDPDQPPAHLLDFQKHSRCRDCGGEIELEKDPERPGQWIVRTTHKDENCPNNSQRPTPRQEHDQKVTDLADAAQTTNPTSNTAPINGMENPLTVNAETTGLQSALAYAEAMAEKSGEGANSVETSIAALEQGEVGGAVTGHLAQAQEHLTAAQAAFQAAHEELTQHVNVQEAYNATPDAGNKQFVTAE